MMISRKKTVYHLQVTAVLLVLTWATVLTSSGRPPSQQPPVQQEACVEPADLKQRLEELYGNTVPGQLHDSFLQLPSLRHALTLPFKGLQDNSTCSQVFSGSKRCHGHGESAVDPCPTYTCLNSDPSRYPLVLLETRCSCSGRCRGISKKKGQDTTPTCQKVTHPVKVLRRTGCRQGVYQYVSTWHQLQVGCACKLVAEQR